MKKEINLYIVEHIYEKDGEEEIKFIGVFSSLKRANDAISKLIEQPGFKDYPASCFQISKDKLNTYEWSEGFISWKDALKEE